MKKLFILFIYILVFSGCATIVGGGGKQNVQLISQDPEATPRVNIMADGGPQEVILPATIQVKGSSEDILVTVNDECYRPNTQSISSKTNPFFFGNIIFGGLLGSSTDILSGAAWKYDKRVVIYTYPNNQCEAK